MAVNINTIWSGIPTTDIETMRATPAAKNTPQRRSYNLGTANRDYFYSRPLPVRRPPQHHRQRLLGPPLPGPE